TNPNSSFSIPPTVAFMNTVAGSGQLALSNVNVTLGAANTFTGGVSLTSPVIVIQVGVGTDTSLGTGTVVVAPGAGQLRADNGPRTVANPVQFAAGSYLGLTGTNSLTITGPTDLNGGQRAVDNTVPAAVFTL